MARNNPFTFVDLTGLRLVRTTAGMSWQRNDDNDPVCTNTDDIKKWHRKDMLANSGDGIFRMGETHYFGRASKPRCSCGILHALHVADFTPCARSGTGGMLLPAEDQPQTPLQLAIASTSAA